MDYVELQEEVKRLREENEKLRNLLAQHCIAIPTCSISCLPTPAVQNTTIESEHKQQKKLLPLTPEEKIAIFQSMFRGREDVFARRWYSTTTQKSGYQPVCLREWNPQFCDKKKYKCADCPNRQFAPLTYQDIYCHLQGRDEHGRDVIGLYPISKDNTCYFLCADFDDKSCEHGYQNDVSAYTAVCRDWQIPYSIERSRSGNGAHVWIFFETPVPAAKARKLGNAILSEAMNREGRISFRSYDRLFPNQDYLPDGGLGNLVALPLQGLARKKGNSVFVDDTFTAYDDQWAYLQGVVKLPANIVETLLTQQPLAQELGELSASSEKKPWVAAKPVSISNEDFPVNLQIVRSNMLYIPLQGLSARAVNHLKRLAAFKNPEFYSKQAMRLSVRNVPRVISCADITEDYLALPRGCEDDVTKLLQDRLIPYFVQDETNPGSSVKIEFRGVLREEQERALLALSAHQTGVLSAATAFGKTVTTAALIAHIHTNTLILVHSKALLSQWKTTLEKFLQIDSTAEDTSHKRGRKKAFSPVGTLSSDGNSLHGIVDIAVIQSCLSGNEVKSFVRNYGMVIVDECHHVPAFSFEQVLKFANARYVYGLTATPIRKDGHQPIIFMQCGMIRYVSDAKSQMQNKSFHRILIPRFTSFRTLSGEQSYSRIMQQLAEDEARNTLIVEDVRKALSQGRTPIVLSNLTSHVMFLAELIRAFCPNVIILVGADSAKNKREAIAQLQKTQTTTPIVLVATGKYIGEGFDYPRLDTLFLAMPISWKGLLAQYAGRLHRDYDGKHDVQIYDYIDIRVPLYERMYRRRLKGYASIGYSLQTEAIAANVTTDTIYTGKDYFPEFLRSIQSAQHSILLSSPWRSHISRIELVEQLSAATTRGVEVIVVLAANSLPVQDLQEKGIEVKQTEHPILRAVILDNAKIWYGDVNFFGENYEQDNVLFFRNPQLAGNLTDAILE